MAIALLWLGVASAGCGSDGQQAAAEQGPPPETVPIRRLTVGEYTASTADLFPGIKLPALSFAPDTRVQGFLNVSTSQTGNLVWAEQFEAAALRIGEVVASDPVALTGCDAAAVGEEACAQPYVFGLAKRAYRRPLTDDEKAGLWTLFLDAEGGDYTARLGATVAAVLLSPNFLFRPEIGDPARLTAGGLVALTSWEIATRLSYLIGGSIPDAELTTAADQNRLSTVSEIATHARRLLALPQSHGNVVKMHQMWLRIDSVGSVARNPAKYPTFTSGLSQAIARESQLFLKDVIFDRQGTFSDLLLAPYSFVNAELAALYGVPAPGADWDRVELDPSQRSGILTQAALLATLAKDVSDEGGTPIGTTVYRGKFVLEQLLCRHIPSPSAEIQAMFPPQDYTKTTRQAAIEHQVSPVCASCHATMDPLGLPFEHYDALGKWRDTDRGMEIDATGSIVTTDTNKNGTTVPFDGIPQLSRIVAELPETRACYVSQWLRFANGRLNADSDQPYIDWLATRFTGDKKLVDLVVDLVTSSGFRQLKVRSGP